MRKIPNNCAACWYEKNCNSAYNTPGCNFYSLIKEKISFFKRIKNIFK